MILRVGLGCLMLLMLQPTPTHAFVLRMVSSSVDQAKSNLPRKPAPVSPPIAASQPPRPPSPPPPSTTTTAPNRKAHTNKYAAFSKKEVDPLRAAIDKKQQTDVEEEKKQASMVPSRGTTVPIPVSSFRPVVATNESTTVSSTSTSAGGDTRKRKKLVKTVPDDSDKDQTSTSTIRTTTTKKVVTDNNGEAATADDAGEEPVVQATLKPLFFSNISAIVPSDPYTFGYTHIGKTKPNHY